MWLTLHYVIVAVYILAPIAAVGLVLVGKRRVNIASPRTGFLVTLAAGTLMGVMLTVIYGVATGGWPGVVQVGLAVYFATSMLTILKAIDAVMRFGVGKVSDKFAGKGRGKRWTAVGLATTLRVVVLFGIGLPYVMAAVVTYRPKVVAADNPKKQLGFAFEPVSFETSDGIRISGWWIPADQKAIRNITPSFGTRTVLVCHGLASSKSNALIMSRAFVPAGYNVLIFDFRGHGESGGQFASFGDLERRDVLAAAQWVKSHKPRESQKLFGVGASMGAAALITAAADPSPAGQSIDAVAVYGTFDDLIATERAVSKNGFPPVMRQIVDLFAIPMASAHVGSNLSNFKPAASITSIWPRPVLIIHGVGDQIIPFERGKALFDAAYQPKQSIWLQKSDHNSIINDENTARQVLQFFEQAEPLPIV